MIYLKVCERFSFLFVHNAYVPSLNIILVATRDVKVLFFAKFGNLIKI